MRIDEADGAGQIFTAALCAWAVDQGKRMIAMLGKRERMRQAVLHGAHISKAASGAAKGKRRALSAWKIKQPGILLVRIRRLLLFGIVIEEHWLPG